MKPILFFVLSSIVSFTFGQSTFTRVGILTGGNFPLSRRNVGPTIGILAEYEESPKVAMGTNLFYSEYSHFQPRTRKNSLEWLVTESQLNFTQKPDEWTGTTIVFEISETGNQTQLQFTHVGLTPEFECYGGCSNGWSMLIHESLFSLITTGQGKEVF